MWVCRCMCGCVCGCVCVGVMYRYLCVHTYVRVDIKIQLCASFPLNELIHTCTVVQCIDPTSIDTHVQVTHTVHQIPQTTTFQLVLATDYTSTYGFYLYGDTNWDIDRRARWQRIVIGHDARDFMNYENVLLQSNTDFFTIDDVVGNSRLPGVWYFNYTSPESDMNSEQLCLQWSKRQSLVTTSFDTVPSACPCTRRQARRDWRFWFAHFWGLSSRPNCATLLFSRQQSTVECCYDDDGSLIVGANDGGSYLLYNPLFYFLDHVQEDSFPYRYCCVESKRCQVYYEHRPSDDCNGYVPLRPCKLLAYISYTNTVHCKNIMNIHVVAVPD